MLSSNSSSYNHNLFTENDITSISHPAAAPHNSFFAFPSSPHLHLPYDYDYDFAYLDHLYHHAPTQTNQVINPPSNPVKKDRHSKISTARGLRDRRMRLSLDVARKFFDLQDLLGYEKASRTVDWLLQSSRSAIRELACTSDEAVSSSTTDKTAVEASSCSKVIQSRRGKRGRDQVQQKRASVGRESRKKARERARERTSQKRRLMSENSTNAAAAATTTAFGESHNFPVDPVKDWRSDEAANEGAFFFNFHHNINNNNNAAFLHQEEEIAELEYNGRPWEAYNSFNLCM